VLYLQNPLSEWVSNLLASGWSISTHMVRLSGKYLTKQTCWSDSNPQPGDLQYSVLTTVLLGCQAEVTEWRRAPKSYLCCNNTDSLMFTTSCAYLWLTSWFFYPPHSITISSFLSTYLNPFALASFNINNSWHLTRQLFNAPMVNNIWSNVSLVDWHLQEIQYIKGTWNILAPIVVDNQHTDEQIMY